MKKIQSVTQVKQRHSFWIGCAVLCVLTLTTAMPAVTDDDPLYDSMYEFIDEQLQHERARVEKTCGKARGLALILLDSKKFYEEGTFDRKHYDADAKKAAQAYRKCRLLRRAYRRLYEDLEDQYIDFEHMLARQGNMGFFESIINDAKKGLATCRKKGGIYYDCISRAMDEAHHKCQQAECGIDSTPPELIDTGPLDPPVDHHVASVILSVELVSNDEKGPYITHFREEKRWVKTKSCSIKAKITNNGQSPLRWIERTDRVTGLDGKIHIFQDYGYDRPELAGGKSTFVRDHGVMAPEPAYTGKWQLSGTAEDTITKQEHKWLISGSCP